ncbi:unnamed protein product, partial [Adineta ricciae]
MAMQLGNATPLPAPFDDQPTTIVFDENRRIADPNAALAPFNGIVNYVLLHANFVEQLSTPHKWFNVVMIFPHMNEQEVYQFVQGHVLTHRSAELFHIFSTNNDANQLRALCRAKLASHDSVRNMNTMRIREICAQTNDLNIEYCEQYRLQHENAGDIGIANLFATQRDQRIGLQLQYNAILRREIRQRSFS